MPELFEAEALPINQPPTKEADLVLGTSLCKLPDPKMAYDRNGCVLRVGYRVAISEKWSLIRRRIQELTEDLEALGDPKIFWNQINYLVPFDYIMYEPTEDVWGFVRDIFNNGQSIRVETPKPLGMWIIPTQFLQVIFDEHGDV